MDCLNDYAQRQYQHSQEQSLAVASLAILDKMQHNRYLKDIY